MIDDQLISFYEDSIFTVLSEVLSSFILLYCHKKEVRQMEHKLVMVINEMAEVLNISQLKRLQEVMLKHFVEKEADSQNVSNEEYLKKFLEAKRIEGCSDRTINYYSTTIDHMLKFVTEPIRRVTTEELRSYLVDYQKINNCSKVTVDNVRRNISSFFACLE